MEEESLPRDMDLTSRSPHGRAKGGLKNKSPSIFENKEGIISVVDGINSFKSPRFGRLKVSGETDEI